MKPTLLHHYHRGRADRERNAPWLHAPQSPADVELCGESEAQAAYWKGFGGRPVPAELEPVAVGR